MALVLHGMLPLQRASSMQHCVHALRPPLLLPPLLARRAQVLEGYMFLGNVEQVGGAARVAWRHKHSALSGISSWSLRML